MLLDNGKEYAFALLKENPQVFVQLMAMYMLAFVATHIKRKNFIKKKQE